MDETHVINQVKEDVCYVSQDFYRDMDIAKYVQCDLLCGKLVFRWCEQLILINILFFRLKGEDNTVMIDYVLPDFSTIKKGFCKVIFKFLFLFHIFI